MSDKHFGESPGLPEDGFRVLIGWSVAELQAKEFGAVYEKGDCFKEAVTLLQMALVGTFLHKKRRPFHDVFGAIGIFSVKWTMALWVK